MPENRPALTIGMATADDFRNTWSTVQSLRMMHWEAMPDVEIIVVDNAPDTPHGRGIQGLMERVPNGRYIAFPTPRGTSAPRNHIFEAARGEAVLVIDAHVFLWPGTIRRLIDWYAANPDCLDLLHGPMLDDALPGIHATEMRDVWRAQMHGIWHTDPRGLDPENPPYEVWGHGLGLFSCRRDAWVGMPDGLQGFGGEEGSLQESFRLAGRRVLCLPFLQWLHQFTPGELKSPHSVNDTYANLLIWHRHNGQSPQPVIDHFREFLPPVQILAGAQDVAARRVPRTRSAQKDNPADQAYAEASRTESDINMHLPRLRALAREAETVVELGVRSGVSTRALIAGRPRRLVSVDIQPGPDLAPLAEAAGVAWEFRQESSVLMEPVPCDLLFVDSLHTDFQLAAELERHAPHVSRWIAIHDTETFGLRGEDGGEGLLKAIGGFLTANAAEWELVEHYKFNNGLTVLRRWNVETDPARGAGDVVAKATHAVGLDRLARSVAKFFGQKCGCSGRQAVLNSWFQFKRETPDV